MFFPIYKHAIMPRCEYTLYQQHGKYSERTMGKEIISILIIRKRKKYDKEKEVLERERSMRKGR